MKTSRLADVLNVEDMRRRAKRRLPRAIFDAIEGGAGDEVSLRENRQAFERIWFRPRAVSDVSSRDLSTTVQGHRVSMPLLLDPCGMTRMMNSAAELAVARSAGRAGTVYVVSTASSYSFERIASAATGPLWFQLYMPDSRPATKAVLARVAEAGYPVLCVNVDSPVTPKRERDARNGLTIPLRVSPKLAKMGISRPRWTADFLIGGRGGDFSFYHAKTAYQKLATTISSFHPVTLDDIAWLRDQWNGPLVVKGIQRGDECAQLMDIGVTGIIVSNHGGRNLDSTLAPIDVLPEVVDAVDGRGEVYVDGGIRRGTDVLKALALGARAVLIGRPYLYGLGAAGEAGVNHILELFRAEIDGAMALLGASTVQDLDASSIVRRGSVADSSVFFDA